MAIAQLSIDIEARLAGFEKQMEKVAKSAEGMAGRMKTSFSALGGVLGAALGGLAAAGAVGQFKELVNYLDKFDESAERIGTSAENLSAYAYAAKMAGVEFDDLNKGLVKFSGTLADAAGGNKDAIELLNRLGVSAKNYGNLDAALNQTADQFAKLENGVGKTALASDAFGEKLGSKMVPLLNGGSAGMKAMREEAEKLGGVIDDKLAKQAADFNDNLDRLATLSSVAGKSLASGLLPWLNEAAESFLIARKNSDSFWDALNKKIPGLQIVNVANELARVRQEYGEIDFRLSNGRAKASDAERFAALEKELAYYEDLSRAKENRDNPPKPKSGETPVTPKTPTGGKKSRETVGAFADYDTILTERVASAIDKTDLVKAQELERTLAKLDQLAAVGLDPAIVKAVRDDLTGAAKIAADELARLNKLLGESDGGQLEEKRKDMELLASALVSGSIDEEKYLDAVNARLSDNSEKLKEQKSLAEDLGLTFASAFEDAIVGGKGFKDVLAGIANDITRILVRKSVTEPLANAIGSINFGAMFSSTTPNAMGGVYNSPSLSAYSNQVHSSPKLFAFAQGAGVFAEAGPEAIMPLSRDSSGRLGVKAESSAPVVNINVQNQGAADGYQATATAQKNGAGIDINVIIAKAIADDQRRNGPITQGFANTFGMNRSTA